MSSSGAGEQAVCSTTAIGQQQQLFSLDTGKNGVKFDCFDH